jgi:hypothetical protein
MTAADDPAPEIIADAPVVPDAPAVEVPAAPVALDERPVPVPDQVAAIVAAEPVPEPAGAKLTDREPLADIQARLRRETDERARGGKMRRQA